MRARPGENPAPPARASEQVVETPAGDQVTVITPGDPKRAPVVATDVVQPDDNRIVASALPPGAVIPAEAPEVVQYVVVKDASFTDRGQRVRATRGKLIDSRHYDIPALLRQGVRMKKLEQGQDPEDLFAHDVA